MQSDLRPKNRITKVSKIDFTDNTMNVSKDYVVYGDEASDTRSSLKHKSKKDQDEFFLTYMPKIYPHKSMIGYKIGDMTDVLSDSLTYNFSYKVESPFTAIANMQIFRIPFSQLKEELSYVAITNRIYPFCLWKSMFSYDSDEEQVILKYPEGKMLAQVPSDVVVENEFFTYKLQYKPEKGSCKIVRTTIVKQPEVSPEKYNLFTASLKQMIEAEKTQLAFVDYVPEKPAKKGKK
jgi:hypothetical protein